MNQNPSKAFAELEKSIYSTLETYSNVHRGSGHFSMVTTSLFELAREIVLEYLCLDKKKYLVIFATPLGIGKLIAQLKGADFQLISSQDFGLPLAVRAVAVRKKNLPKDRPLLTGGGTTRLVSPDSVIWAVAPDKFEPGTPAVVNIIAFAKALMLVKKYGKEVFQDFPNCGLSVSEILYNDDFHELSGKELLEKLRSTLVGKNFLVSTQKGERPFINFDNAASTPAFEPVWNVYRQSLRQMSELQQNLVNHVKSVCADFLEAPLSDYEIIFTSNTTEAINLAAENLGLEPAGDYENVIVSSLLEHSSNDLPWRDVKNASIIRLMVDKEGFIDLNELEKCLSDHNEKFLYGKKRVKLVAISGASNVLGTYNNLEEISRIAQKYGAQLLVDAAQLVAHRKIEMNKTGIGILAFSAHKMYAPFGCGVLVIKKNLFSWDEAAMEKIRLLGEENAAGIAALGKALILLKNTGLDVILEEEQKLTALALRGMSKIPSVKIHGTSNPDSKNFIHKGGVIPFEIKNTMPKGIADRLARQGGVGVRYGCHCAHILVKHVLNISPFIQKFQNVLLTLFPKLQLQGVLRISFGMENTPEEVTIFLEALETIAKKPAVKSHHPDFASDKVLGKSEVKMQIDMFMKETSNKIYGGK